MQTEGSIGSTKELKGNTKKWSLDFLISLKAIVKVKGASLILNFEKGQLLAVQSSRHRLEFLSRKTAI